MKYPLDEKIKRFQEKIQDLKENRELLVVDKYGNRYYQYYSYHGLPTRRVVLNNMTSFNKWDDDPFMLAWLQKRRMTPPSQEELEKMYIEQEEFARRGLEWDKKEKHLIEAWKNKQKEALNNERKETKSIGDADTYQPGAWDKNRLKVNSTELVEMKEEKRIVEGASSLPGKYIMEFKEEDQKWMKRREDKMNAPYIELLKNIDRSQYTYDKMLQKTQNDIATKRNEIKEKQKQLTNLGKKILEKKEGLKEYKNFRERFKDVFDNGI